MFSVLNGPSVLRWFQSGHARRKEYFISAGQQKMTSKFHHIRHSRAGEGAVTVVKEGDCGKAAPEKLNANCFYLCL